MKTRDALTVMLCLGLGSCGGHRSLESTDPVPDRSAIIIQGKDISGVVLDGLRTRISGMRVITNQGPCPRIVFRGQQSLTIQTNPTVYVDGTRMLDTCILNQISGGDVDFVEVYPSGNTNRANIERNLAGLILIFRRRE